MKDIPDFLKDLLDREKPQSEAELGLAVIRKIREQIDKKEKQCHHTKWKEKSR